MLKYLYEIKRFLTVFINGSKGKRNAFFFRKPKSIGYKLYLLWMSENKKQPYISKRNINCGFFVVVVDSHIFDLFSTGMQELHYNL